MSMHADMNWFGVLEHHASRAPDNALAIFREETVTYGEMATRAAALAGGLHERGVGDGDVVALLSYNCIEFLETIFAANYLGAIAMPINWRLAAPELRYILEHSEARALVCDATLVDLADEAMNGMERGIARVCIERPAPHEWTALADLRVASGPPPRRVPAAGDDIHRLMYTSGTTGRPKGVMITHANLAWKNLAHIVEFGFTSADLGLACGPLYHVGALDLTTTSLIAAGATVIIHRVFDAAEVVDEIERSRVTTVWLAPAMVNAIMAEPNVEQRDLSSVRLIINGGEKMPIPLIERLQRTFPSAWFADAYGLTETVSGDTFLDRDSIVRKLGSVGRPCLYLELDIWDEHGGVAATGRTWGSRASRTEGVQGLLARSRRDRSRVCRWLVPHRRHRREGRRRVPLHRRSTQGHDRVRRREHRELRGRAGPLRARVGRRSRGRRASRRSMGRGAGRVRRRERGRDDDARGAGRALPWAARALQGAEAGRPRRCAPEESFGKGPETRAARSNVLTLGDSRQMYMPPVTTATRFMRIAPG